MTPTVKPILRFPGAKWQIAAWVVAHLPPHTRYCEPFFGSGAVFFHKPTAAHEVLVDVDADVVNLFTLLRDRPADLIRAIDLTPWSRHEFDQAREATDDPIERARRFAVRCWQSYGNAGAQRNNGWRHTGERLPLNNTTTVWRQLPARLAAVVDRLKHAHIECRPAVEVITRLQSPDVLLYCDPPYLRSTRGGARYYRHELTDADHVALLQVLQAHPGPVVLSGYHAPLYATHLADWSTVERLALVEHGQARCEVLWLNRCAVERLGYRQLALLGDAGSDAAVQTDSP